MRLKLEIRLANLPLFSRSPVCPDALNLVLLAFLPVTICEISQKLKFFAIH
jgi:hypothetical protein